MADADGLVADTPEEEAHLPPAATTDQITQESLVAETAEPAEKRVEDAPGQETTVESPQKQQGIDAGPPKEAELQTDGSYLQTLDDGSSLRWTQRPDGSWRKPEHRRAAATSVRQQLSPALKHVDSSAAPSSEASKSAANPYPMGFPVEPPEEAVEQADGSYLLELLSGATLRWTMRPDGSWRKPEHKREGWVGDLELEKYQPPPVRNGGMSMHDASDEFDEQAGYRYQAASHQCNGNELDKHPLQHRWAIVVRRRGALASDSFGQRMFEFDTVEDFWCMHNYAYQPAALIDVDSCLLHVGAAPSWDDPIFVAGGRWVLRLNKVKPNIANAMWLSLQLALIGEAFADFAEDLVAGAVFSVRKRKSRIALWTVKAVDERRILAMGRAFREVLAETVGVSDMYTSEFVFEDFRTQAITLQLPRPGIAGITEGIFQ